MQILLLASTEMEIAPILNRMPAIDHLITGVGSHATIYHLLKRLHQIDYDLIIQAGIAGCFANEIEKAQVVCVQRDCFADVGISEQQEIYTLFEKKFADPQGFPFKNGFLINENELLMRTSLQLVNAVTVNTVSDDRSYIDKIRKKFEPEIETMEGAALHYVCLQEQVSFLQLRSISNRVGERDKSKWNLNSSIVNLNKELGRIIHGLSNGNLNVNLNQ